MLNQCFTYDLSTDSLKSWTEPNLRFNSNHNMNDHMAVIRIKTTDGSKTITHNILDYCAADKEESDLRVLERLT